MAKILSKPKSNATSGERSFYNRIKHYFSEDNDVFIYFEPNIDGLHPDFLLLSPKYGVIIIEVKDYSSKYIKTAAKTGKWQYIDDNNQVKAISNPFDQIYQYWRVVKNKVNFCKFPSNVQIPIIRLIVFSQISHDSLFTEEIKNICPRKVHTCFEEEVNWNKNFHEFISDIIPLNFRLRKKYFQILRANIVPTCRLPTIKQADLTKYYTKEDQIKLLDREQEKLARRLGEGHRLIFGVAGSGKTVLLIARARFLALRHPNWKILVLCYNRLLRDLFFHLLNPQDFDADITINTFHGWARRYLLNANNEYSRLYNEAENTAKKETKLNDFFQTTVPKLLLEMLKNGGESERIKYDAILIDEAQDFEQDWFRPIIEVLNPKTNSLLITCDGLQGIYERKNFSWASVGIEARGRVRRFEKSYRNPIEIGRIAQEILPKNLKDMLDKVDEYLSTKEFMGTHGSVEVMVSESRTEEYRALIEKISRILKRPQSILMLFKYNLMKRNFDHPLFGLLQEKDINWKGLEDYNYNSKGLLIGTLHGTKGLEFDTIIIPEINSYESEKDRQLLYVGMTRSKRKLILSANKANEFISNLKKYETLG